MADIELEYLTDNEAARTLSLWYWQVDPKGKFLHAVSDIAEAYRIPSAKVAATVAANCRAFFADEFCSGCRARYPFSNRTEYERREKQRRHFGGPVSGICDACKALQRTVAQRAAEEEARLRQGALRKEVDQRAAMYPTPDELGFREAVFLAGLLRAGGSEDLSFIAPHAAFNGTLSPSKEFDLEILDRLYRHDLICIHPGSSQDATVFEGGALKSFYPFKVHWILPLHADGPSPTRFVEDLEALLKADPNEWPPDWHVEAQDLHRVVAFQECAQYLRVVLEDHGFDLQVGEKLSVILRATLTRFSIGQTQNFMWRAARDAAAFYLREQVSRPHAANTVPGTIQRLAERAWAERWTMKSFGRFRVPESHISQVLFTAALKLPEGGFTAVPPAPAVAEIG